MAESWRGFVNGLLYKVQFERNLNNEVVDWLAQDILKSPLLGMTPEEEYSELTAALQSGASLAGDMPQPHSDVDIREFLTAVLRRMDTLRPW
jgi:hypothetical protein